VKHRLSPICRCEIIRYFQVRQRFEKRQYVVPVTADFEFLNEAKCRFHGDRFERLYKAWISGTLIEPDSGGSSARRSLIEPCFSRRIS